MHSGAWRVDGRRQKGPVCRTTYTVRKGLRTLGTFGEVSGAEVRAPPAFISSPHHPALHLVSEWRPPAARAMSVDLLSPFFFRTFSAPGGLGNVRAW